jgi:hypothetical protein
VPKLIIDEPTLQMLASKTPGFPIHVGPGGDLLEPGVLDLVEGDEDTGQWQPGDRRTKLVVLGGEACREIVFCAERFEDPTARRRTLKNLTVPVCNLMDVVSALLSSLNDPESRKTRLAWPFSDQNTYLAAGRRLRKVHSKGRVRKVRHKLGAHLDPDVFDDADVRLKPEDVLSAMGDSLVLFMLALNHKARTFSWIRSLGRSDDGSRLVVETMFDYPICVRWITDANGKVLDLSAATLAADPRREIQERIFAGIRAYNELARAAGTRLPSIHTRDTEEVLGEEGARHAGTEQDTKDPTVPDVLATRDVLLAKTGKD